jgi:hypothetical protein
VARPRQTPRQRRARLRYGPGGRAAGGSPGGHLGAGAVRARLRDLHPAVRGGRGGGQRARRTAGRRQAGGPGIGTYGAPGTRGGYPRSPNPDGWDVQYYLAHTPELFAAARERLGTEVSLMHDVHSRLTPKQAIVLARALEPYRLSFLEDVIAPEHYDRLPEVRAASAVPIAVGEQIGSVPDAVRLIRDGGVDLLRLHTSAVGGLTPTPRMRSSPAPRWCATAICGHPSSRASASISTRRPRPGSRRSSSVLTAGPPASAAPMAPSSPRDLRDKPPEWHTTGKTGPQSLVQHCEAGHRRPLARPVKNTYVRRPHLMRADR